MTKIMFVCHGNICRSPMAEFIMKNLVKEHNMDDEFFIRSSATSTEEIGNPVYPPAVEELNRHGISCDGKRAVQLEKSDYHKYDLFLIMDDINQRNIKRIFTSDPENKVHKLLEFTVSGGNVADPWYSGRFDVAYSDIYRGCKGLFEHLLNEKRR